MKVCVSFCFAIRSRHRDPKREQVCNSGDGIFVHLGSHAFKNLVQGCGVVQQVEFINIGEPLNQ